MRAQGAKVWFITGASSGLGRALSAAAAARGDQVVATARTVESLRDLQASHPDHVTVLQQIDTDLVGVLRVTRAVLPVLRDQRAGHLVQMSSISGGSRGSASASRWPPSTPWKGSPPAWRPR